MKPSLKLAIFMVCIGASFALYRMATHGVASASPVSATNPPVTGSTAPIAGVKTTGNLIDPANWVYYDLNGAEGSKEDLTPAVSGLPQEAHPIRVHVDKVAKQIFDVGLSYHFNDVAFANGEKVTFRFKARATGKNLIAPQMQLDRAPQYPACWTKFIELTPDWQDYSFTFTTSAYAPKEAALVLKLGQSTGVIDLADISLERSAASTPLAEAKSNP